MHFVYIGRGAKYTAGRRPVRLVYQEAFRSVRETTPPLNQHFREQLFSSDLPPVSSTCE